MYCSPTRGCEDTVLCCTVLLLWCNDPEIPEFLTANHKPFSGQPGNSGTFCKGMFFIDIVLGLGLKKLHSCHLDIWKYKVVSIYFVLRQ